jgi:hypothetical protein
MGRVDTAILQQAEINKLERPGKASVKLLMEWLEHPDGGDFFPHGREKRVWDNDSTDDLVAISTLSSRHGETDPFTRWLNASMFPWCHRHGAHRFKVSFFEKNEGSHSSLLISTGANNRQTR